jgi:hypothetical protein
MVYLVDALGPLSGNGLALDADEQKTLIGFVRDLTYQVTKLSITFAAAHPARQNGSRPLARSTSVRNARLFNGRSAGCMTRTGRNLVGSWVLAAAPRSLRSTRGHRRRDSWKRSRGTAPYAEIGITAHSA